jgi:DNA-binding FrmR family transcriptional regulator
MTPTLQSTETINALRKRLNRIEGQVRGVRKMLDEGRDCRDVVQQVSAVRSAVHQVGLELMKAYADQCLRDPESEMGRDEVLEYLFTTMSKWS